VTDRQATTQATPGKPPAAGSLASSALLIG
jgi:hypothetical protein